MTPYEIEATTRRELYGSFPYRDCRELQGFTTRENLIPDLSMYFADIVGFAINASSLSKRSETQLRRGLPIIRKTFSERFPEHKELEAASKLKKATKLARRLETADTIRLELIPLIEQALGKNVEERYK